MSNIEFVNEGKSAVGKPDQRVIKKLEKLHPLPDSFLSFSENHHGQIPVGGYVKGTKHRIGRFLSLIDEKSSLPGEFRPHFEDPSIDERVMRSIAAVIGFESATSRALHYGERLLPFAALYAGKNHPDEMCMDRYYVDFLCFDYERKESDPPVVLWISEKANRDFMSFDDGEIENPNYKKFTIPIAKSFTDLLNILVE
jgi:hypothetical protein